MHVRQGPGFSSGQVIVYVPEGQAPYPHSTSFEQYAWVQGGETHRKLLNTLTFFMLQKQG